MCLPRRELLLIQARNDHIKQGLRRAYADKAPEGQLEVFCVSNKLYDKYCRKYNLEMVSSSEVPALRKFCKSITAEAQLREANNFLQSSLFSLLNSLAMWAKTNLDTNNDRKRPRSDVTDRIAQKETEIVG